jgi:hypothetical protein
MNTDTPQSITPDRLTEILHNRADQKLKKEIAASTPNPKQYFGKWVPADRLLMQTPDHLGRLHLPFIIEAFQEILFAANQEAARAAEVTGFLAKVENTAAELDAIREEINQ